MKRPNFQEKTEVKVICKKMPSFYGKRGHVTKILVRVDGHEYDSIADKDAIKAAYAEGKEAEMVWHVSVRFPESEIEDSSFLNPKTEYQFEPEDIEPVQKKFIDIEHIREDDIILGKKADGTDAVRLKNTGAFEPGDIIQITTKIDGANASIAWDETTGKLEIFSRTNLLDSPGALRGFYDYVKTEVEPEFLKRMNSDFPSLKEYVIFGEWCVGHTIKDYNKEWFNKWRVYDIWDKTNQCYLLQNIVEAICEDFGFEYIEELYYGPFISWEHCKSFLNKSTAYGPTQEGIVIKNQSKLGINNKYPCYLKIVNTAFAEHQHSKKEKKPIDPLEDLEKQNAANLASTIITEARIRKLILKLIDEAKLPSELKPTDMSAIMKLLPKYVFDDVIKEEKEVVVQLGKFAGKVISQQTAKLARKIVIGSI